MALGVWGVLLSAPTVGGTGAHQGATCGRNPEARTMWLHTHRRIGPLLLLPCPPPHALTPLLAPLLLSPLRLELGLRPCLCSCRTPSLGKLIETIPLP